MRIAFTGYRPAICLALFLASLTAVAYPQALVYVQTHQGVEAFESTATGQLTKIPGSPFATVGQIAGVNGKYLISVGTTNLRTYEIKSKGAVGKLASQVNTADNAGGDCGLTSYNPTILDHTGQYIYVTLSQPNIAKWLFA